jgi:hypothetical protein
MRTAQCVCVEGVRLLPDSRRAPVLTRPPRDPVLARPPRDGRALSRLVGVLGGISLLARSKVPESLLLRGSQVRVPGRADRWAQRRGSCKARQLSESESEETMCATGVVQHKTGSLVKQYGRDSRGRVQGRMRVRHIVLVLMGTGPLSSLALPEGLGNVAGSTRPAETRRYEMKYPVIRLDKIR